MAFNIGLESLNHRIAPTMSNEDLLASYIECERLVAASEQFFAYGDQLHATFENVMSLRATAKRFGSTEGMAVINDLVKDEFHGNFSLAASTEAAETLWEKIKKFFAKIWAWIKDFFYRVLNFFGGVEGRLAKLAGQLTGMLKGKDAVKLGVDSGYDTDAKGKMRPWHPMVDKEQVQTLTVTLDTTTKKVKSKRAKAVNNPTIDEADSIVVDCEQAIKDLANTTRGEQNKAIEKITEAIAYVENLRKEIITWKRSKAEAEQSFKGFEGILDTTKKKGLIKEAQAWQKATAAEMKLYNKYLSTFMRTAAHTLANCKPVAK